jgi:hypothetical protein
MGRTARAQQAGWESSIGPSSFVFQGAVRRTSASNIRSFPASDSSAVVLVDKVYRAPGSLGDFTGREVTVLLSSPLPVGTQQGFVTEVVLYAETILLREVGRVPASATKDTAAFGALVSAALTRQATELLRARLATAQLVVAGRVAAVRAAPERLAQRRRTEHDPDWREALILVDAQLKGAAPGDSVVVLFANSQDVMWDRAPKLREGQDGVWLLRPPPLEGLGIEQYLTVLDPLDVHTREELPRIRSLLAPPR